MKKIILSLLSAVSITLVASEKVLIITHSHSRPDFIELHDKTFKAFLKDDYEYVVFNDAPNQAMCNAIEKTCTKLNVRCIRVPQELHNQRNDPGARHIHGIMHSLNTVGFDHDGIVFLIDSDMFLFKPFSIKDFVGDAHIVGQKDVRPHVGPTEVTYMTPLLVFMNMKTMPHKRTINFDGGIVNGHACDVGGHLHYYLKDTPNLQIKFIPGLCVTDLAEKNNVEQLRSLGYDSITANWVSELKNHFDPSDPHRLQFHGDSHFLHYVAGGSNWNHRSQAYHEKKTRIINNFINHMIEKYS
jgi:hypothetical protein